MTYEILDLKCGDVLAAYDFAELAKARLVHFVAAHPERGDDLALAKVDDTGHAVGDPVPARSLAGHRMA
jgi:hypothetical protein